MDIALHSYTDEQAFKLLEYYSRFDTLEGQSIDCSEITLQDIFNIVEYYNLSTEALREGFSTTSVKEWLTWISYKHSEIIRDTKTTLLLLRKDGEYVMTISDGKLFITDCSGKLMFLRTK